MGSQRAPGEWDGELRSTQASEGLGSPPAKTPGSQAPDTTALVLSSPLAPGDSYFLLPHTVALGVSGKPQGTLWPQSGCSQAKFSPKVEGVR